MKINQYYKRSVDIFYLERRIERHVRKQIIMNTDVLCIPNLTYKI